MKHTIILLIIVLLMGCASNIITEEELAGYKNTCERQTTTVVEAERTVVIDACVKERVNDELEYVRAIKELEYLEEYYRQVILCADSGGQMMIQRRSAGGSSRFGSDNPPRRDDTYGCMSSRDFNSFMRGY